MAVTSWGGREGGSWDWEGRVGVGRLSFFPWRWLQGCSRYENHETVRSYSVQGTALQTVPSQASLHPSLLPAPQNCRTLNPSPPLLTQTDLTLPIADTTTKEQSFPNDRQTPAGLWLSRAFGHKPVCKWRPSRLRSTHISRGCPDGSGAHVTHRRAPGVLKYMVSVQRILGQELVTRHDHSEPRLPYL